MSSECIGILVSTMTGTAELCADEVAGALEAEGYRADILLTDDLDASVLDRFDHVVVISSTYGQGDIPDNGQRLFAAIDASPALVGVRFAVFALGDRTYAATFCEAGRKWDALFAGKGGVRSAALVQHDASSGTLAEDEAGAWAAGWARTLKRAA